MWYLDQMGSKCDLMQMHFLSKGFTTIKIDLSLSDSEFQFLHTIQILQPQLIIILFHRVKARQYFAFKTDSVPFCSFKKAVCWFLVYDWKSHWYLSTLYTRHWWFAFIAAVFITIMSADRAITIITITISKKINTYKMDLT